MRLKTINIDHDRQFHLPFTKKAIEAAGGETYYIDDITQE